MQDFHWENAVVNLSYKFRRLQKNIYKRVWTDQETKSQFYVGQLLNIYLMQIVMEQNLVKQINNDENISGIFIKKIGCTIKVSKMRFNPRFFLAIKMLGQLKN